jgi:hypothetical protein
MTTNNTSREAMAFAMAYPETPSRAFHNAVFKCRVVLHHSHALAERVLNGSITLGEAFSEAQEAQTISTPSLPVLNSMRASVGEIAPAELKEFMRIFG